MVEAANALRRREIKAERRRARQLPRKARMTERKTRDERLRTRGEFARVLLALRSEFGLSQRQLAQLAGMTQPEIARFETGGVSPTWKTALRLLGALDARLEVKIKRRGRLVKI
jgi:DNA-binding XRE family transcriptional regulator